MPNLGPTELIIIAFVLILLFGAKKLPDAARSIGRSMRIFKSEVKEMHNDDAPAAEAQPVAPQQIAAPQPQIQQQAPQVQQAAPQFQPGQTYQRPNSN